MADVDMYTDRTNRYILQALLGKGLIMGTKFIDRTGMRYGKLVALRRHGTNALNKVTWECLCDCGKTTVVPSGALATGNTKSCGCVVPNLKHGGTGKGSYNTWRAMMRRCYKEQDKDYKRYGALGITVCPEWHVYENFAKDMGEPEGTKTLDRIDPYGNYEKANCRWASITIQNRNVRVRRTSKSGHTGVRLRDGRWYGEVTAKKKKYYSKACNTIEEAVAARKELELKHWGKP